MGFPTKQSDKNGLTNDFGNTKPEDVNSNKGPGSGSMSVGVVKGRLKFSKSSVADLNTGVCPVRDDY